MSSKSNRYAVSRQSNQFVQGILTDPHNNNSVQLDHCKVKSLSPQPRQKRGFSAPRVVLLPRNSKTSSQCHVHLCTKTRMYNMVTSKTMRIICLMLVGALAASTTDRSNSPAGQRNIGVVKASDSVQLPHKTAKQIEFLNKLKGLNLDAIGQWKFNKSAKTFHELASEFIMNGPKSNKKRPVTNQTKQELTDVIKKTIKIWGEFPKSIRKFTFGEELRTSQSQVVVVQLGEPVKDLKNIIKGTHVRIKGTDKIVQIIRRLGRNRVLIKYLQHGNWKKEPIAISRIEPPKYAVKKVLKDSNIYAEEKKAAELQKQLTGSRFINNIVKTYDEDPKFYYILMQLGDKHDFYAHVLTLRGPISKIFDPATRDEDKIKFYFACIVRAIEKMHSKNIVHRDLKYDNLLLNPRTGYLQVTDFGLSKILENINNDYWTYGHCGTDDFVPPEMIQGEWYGKGVDWWSAGVILHIMMGKSPPFGKRTYTCQAKAGTFYYKYWHKQKNCNNRCGQYKDICEKLYSKPWNDGNNKKLSQAAQHLIHQLLTKVPANRLRNDPKALFPGCLASVMRNVKGVQQGTVVMVQASQQQIFTNPLLRVQILTIKSDNDWIRGERIDLPKEYLRPLLVSEHPWFNNFDWKRLDAGTLRAPYVPNEHASED